MSKRSADNFLNFPTTTEFQRHGDQFNVGISSHQKEPRPLSFPSGVMALDFAVFDLEEWYSECMNVLEAHDWLCWDNGIGSTLTARLANDFGPDAIEDFQEGWDNMWRYAAWEIGAARFAPTLSRLWYVCNMLALHFIHDDPLRLGFFWSEYRQRLTHERAALTGKASLEASAKGGQMRAAQAASNRKLILKDMWRYIDAGHSASNAARLVYERGLGSSVEANRKLFQRNPPKK